MLAESLTLYDFQRLDEYQNREQPTTIFGGAIFTKPPKAPVISDGGVMADCGDECMVVDKYTPDPPLTYQPFSDKLWSDVPSVLGLGLTDKDSRGVYESTAPQRQATPLNATLLNDPAVQGLETVYFGDTPLGTSFAGGVPYMSGSDPMAQMPFVEDEQTAPETTDVCAWYDFPCKFQKVKGESTILIVGVILLAVGIFALTR